MDDFRILLQSDMRSKPELTWPAAAQEAYLCLAQQLPAALEHAEFKEKVMVSHQSSGHRGESLGHGRTRAALGTPETWRLRV